MTMIRLGLGGWQQKTVVLLVPESSICGYFGKRRKQWKVETQEANKKGKSIIYSDSAPGIFSFWILAGGSSPPLTLRIFLPLSQLSFLFFVFPLTTPWFVVSSKILSSAAETAIE